MIQYALEIRLNDRRAHQIQHDDTGGNCGNVRLRQLLLLSPGIPSQLWRIPGQIPGNGNGAGKAGAGEKPTLNFSFYIMG